jgi:hypothetical protein
MRGRSLTWLLIAAGAVLGGMGPIFVHPAPDNLRKLLIITAIGAVILGLGLGRLPLARE